MGDKIYLKLINRRDFILSASAAGLLTTFISSHQNSLISPGYATTAFKDWKAVLQDILGAAKPAEGKVSLALPEIADSAKSVPFTVAVDSPMTQDDHVLATHIIATRNPLPQVASFYFSLFSGKAEASCRMRLSEAQEIIAVAKVNDGKFYIAKRDIRIAKDGFDG